MAKLTRRTGKGTGSTRTSSSIKRPISSSPKKQYTYKPKTVRSNKAKPSTQKVQRTSYKKPSRKVVAPRKRTTSANTGSLSTFQLWLKIIRAMILKYRTIVIIVLCSIVVLAGGLFAYFKFFAKNEAEQDDNDVKLENETVTDSQTSAEDASLDDDYPMLTESDDPLANNQGGQDVSEEIATSQKEEVFIGITIGDPTAYEEKLLQKMEEAINMEYKNGTLGGDCIPYDSDGDISQQIQDMRSLANIGAKAIIVCSTSLDDYIVITDMAKEKGIKVVAVDAPIDSGYDVNIVTDYDEFGSANAKFVADNIGKGNLVQFIDTDEGLGNDKTLKAFNSAAAEYSNININASANMDEFSSVKKAYNELSEQGTIEAIYAENGYALNVLNEAIKREQVPKVFIGDGTAGFIKKWYELINSGVKIEKEDPDDEDETIEVLVEAPSAKIYARPAPYGAAATAVKFAIRLAKGMELKPQMFSGDKTYYYKGSIAIIEEVLPYYYEMVKDKEDTFVINDWPSDYEIDQYFEGAVGSYYDTSELRVTQQVEDEKIEESTEEESEDDEKEEKKSEDGEKSDEKEKDESDSAE